jgi:hypothetical protein
VLATSGVLAPRDRLRAEEVDQGRQRDEREEAPVPPSIEDV